MSITVRVRVTPAENGLANTTGIMAMGAAVMGAAAMLAGVPVRMPTASSAGALAAMAIGGSAIAYLFWNAGIARMGAARTALFLNLVPVSTMAIAALAGQPPRAVQGAGAVLVLAAVGAPAWWSRRSRVAAPG